MNIKINSNNLTLLSDDVITPSYDRSKVKAGIAHIGIGGFHRAHQAFYADELLEKHDVIDCGICGVGLLDSDRKIYNTLQNQDGLYTLLTKLSDGTCKARVIGSIVEFLFAPEHPAAVIDKLASSDIKIISLTITEGGYNYNEASDSFDFSTPQIQWDLQNPNKPKTVFGYITQALKLRKERKTEGCTIQSCDNIQGNGKLTKRMLTSFISKAEPDILDWVNKNVSFPNSMVDRITPVTTDADIQLLKDQFNIDDQWPVVCESFNQWVIEDEFIAGRPELDLVGAQFVEDVEPFENMKLGLLNAGHSVLGILGAIHGYGSIDQAVNDTDFEIFLRAYMDDEVTPVLEDLDGVDLEAYKDSLIERFKNPYIKDSVARICLESSAKIPKFMLSTLRAQLKVNGPISRLSFVIAAWSKYNLGVDENGNTYPINDALSKELQEAALKSLDFPNAFLELKSVFGDLIEHIKFVEEYTVALEQVNKNSIKTCIKEYNKQLQ